MMLNNSTVLLGFFSFCYHLFCSFEAPFLFFLSSCVFLRLQQLHPPNLELSHRLTSLISSIPRSSFNYYSYGLFYHKSFQSQIPLLTRLCFLTHYCYVGTLEYATSQ